MSQILEATFDGEVFRPAQVVELPPDTRVELTVTVKRTSDEKPKSFLRVARALRLEGPADWSSRLDDHAEAVRGRHFGFARHQGVAGGPGR